MNEELNKMNEPKKYFGKTLDPIHIGAGGYRLGRVDNTIVRDPTTDVPKIPGTSLAGVIKEFVISYLTENNDACQSKNDEKDKRKYAEEEVKKYFGDENRQGVLRFYDGQIILFPVYSSVGTIWITTKDLFEYWFEEDKNEDNKLKIPDEIEKEDKAYAIKGIKEENKTLNLGWILIEVETKNSNMELTIPDELKIFVKRIVVVPEKLFSALVNDNLEVRTSVKIDKTTGTAADKGLFTYEAIPRGTIIGFEIGFDEKNAIQDDLVEKIKPYFKLLGIGGMGTRGFGRVEFFTLKNNKQSNNNGGSNENDKS